ncbi:MAG: hypothetical protein JW806_05975 [Sedimentisphaerales bacterium]|nr:hypothetical protein [Sedimentisphaerales bacterium]
MTERENKNIDELLSKFYSPEQAEEMKNDIASGDLLFEKYPAPGPSQQVTAEIKQKIAQRLENRKSPSLPTIILKTASAAAIIVIFSAVLLLNHTRIKSDRYTADNKLSVPTEQTDYIASEIDISTFEDELKQLKNELLTINLGEYSGTNGTLVDQVEELELEIIEVENTFWKG